MSCWLMEGPQQALAVESADAMQARLLGQQQQLLGSFSAAAPGHWFFLRACLDQQVPHQLHGHPGVGLEVGGRWREA